MHSSSVLCLVCNDCSCTDFNAIIFALDAMSLLWYLVFFVIIYHKLTIVVASSALAIPVFGVGIIWSDRTTRSLTLCLNKFSFICLHHVICHLSERDKMYSMKILRWMGHACYSEGSCSLQFFFTCFCSSQVGDQFIVVQFLTIVVILLVMKFFGLWFCVRHWWICDS